MKISYAEGLFYILILLVLSMTWTSYASREIIVPHISETPAIDGRIDETEWMSTAKFQLIGMVFTNCCGHLLLI